MYRVRLHRRAERALDKLPDREASRIVAILKGMEEDPLQGDVRRLSGTRSPLWRRRAGNYRIIFSVAHERRLVVVERIERRSGQTYERL